MNSLYDQILNCNICKENSISHVRLQVNAPSPHPFVFCDTCSQALDEMKSGPVKETQIMKTISKSIVMLLVSLNFVACAAMEKRIVDPQGRSETQRYADGNACYKYAKSGYSSTFVEKYDQCMKANGYDFEYVAVKQ